VFGLPNETHRTRCLEVQGEIEAALSDHFGRPVGMVLVVDEAAPGADDGPSAAPPAAPPRPAPPRPARTDGHDDGGRPGPVVSDTVPDRSDEDVPDDEDLSAFDESELGAVAEIDNSAEARVLQAFPGAEEVV